MQNYFADTVAAGWAPRNPSTYLGDAAEPLKAIEVGGCRAAVGDCYGMRPWPLRTLPVQMRKDQNAKDLLLTGKPHDRQAETTSATSATSAITSVAASRRRPEGRPSNLGPQPINHQQYDSTTAAYKKAISLPVVQREGATCG